MEHLTEKYAEENGVKFKTFYYNAGSYETIPILENICIKSEIFSFVYEYCMDAQFGRVSKEQRRVKTIFKNCVINSNTNLNAYCKFINCVFV